MEESVNMQRIDDENKDILYSVSIKAGKRIYYLDVKKNFNNDLFLAITESKKTFSKEGEAVFEKHKLFLYQEDFDKFISGINDAVNYIKEHNSR
jgi:hypothetical protein